MKFTQKGAIFLCTGLYFYVAYFLHRSDFAHLVLIEVLLFIATYGFIRYNGNKFGYLVGIGILFRLVFLGSVPVLSQDFYRFIWDGRLVFQGINPYLFTPESVVLNPSEYAFTIPQFTALYEGMGHLNGSHFSNYPPVNQLFFSVAALVAGKSILGSALVMRVVILMADIGILYFGRKLLVALGQKPVKIFWYFLNPFVIIEMTGNLHFESVMLFFLVWSLYLLQQRRWMWAAVIFGLSVSVKLIPLLFLPLFFKWFLQTEKTKKGFLNVSVFYLIALATLFLSFLPFYSSVLVSNYSKTLSLWFQNFEFNASVYYVIRWVGYKIVGWNIIATVGKILPIIVFIFVLMLSFFRKNKDFRQVLIAMLFSVSFYFLLATTVHPWYVATVLLLSVFTRYRFALVWSLAVVLSYSAYGSDGFAENYLCIAFEYIVVIGFFTWEFFINKQRATSLKSS